MGFLVKNIGIGLISLFLGATTVQAIIFGADDRVEIYNQPILNQTVSPAVAAMVSPVFLIKDPMGYIMDFPKISDNSEVALCKGEKFYGQPTASVSCTGFLVAPDLLMTAGHCMTHYNTEVRNTVTSHCSDFKWAFDYKYENAVTDINPLLTNENIASCKEVVYAKFMYKIKDSKDSSGFEIHGEDIALIRLDRHFDRPTIKLNPSVKPQQLVKTVGHPTGLPQKATLNGRVLDLNHEHYFTMNLDVLGGNSGSPVLNSNNEAIGIVVRAFPSLDYVYSDKDQCARPNRCSMDLKSCNDKDEEEDTVMYSHGQILTDEVIELINKNTQFM